MHVYILILRWMLLVNVTEELAEDLAKARFWNNLICATKFVSLATKVWQTKVGENGRNTKDC